MRIILTYNNVCIFHFNVKTKSVPENNDRCSESNYAVFNCRVIVCCQTPSDVFTSASPQAISITEYLYYYWSQCISAHYSLESYYLLLLKTSAAILFDICLALNHSETIFWYDHDQSTWFICLSWSFLSFSSIFVHIMITNFIYCRKLSQEICVNIINTCICE